jgi:hypothetical protein
VIVLILIAATVLLVVDAKNDQREALRSGDWVNDLPSAEYKPSRGMLELEINDLPPAPVKTSATNSLSVKP